MEESAVRVLLVDDDEDEYVIVSGLLQAAGSDRFRLSWASTYEQGLESIQSEACDVCLVDYRLGRRTGLDLLAEVMARPNHPQAILLTGEGDRGVDVTATKAGAADYLVKGGLTAVLLERSIRYAVERGRILKALRDASELAQSLNLAKSAFLAAMSHEIRAPMHAILGMADMLWESPLDADQRQYVEVFRRAGSDLLTLINGILDLSKIEAGHLELERVEFDLQDAVDQVIELAAVKAHDKGLILLSHLLPGVATSLIGDPTRLRQVLTNLLGNALKFTVSGEIVLTARNHASGKSGEIEFSVSDTGIGIPANKLETIFDDFAQAETATTRKYGGTGLGLGISRRLVEAMGGSLTASSSAGVGSSFRFIAKFEVAQTNAREAPGAYADLQGKRVLLIDANTTSRLILSETFEAWGLSCDPFQLMSEALTRLPATMAGEDPPALVVMENEVPSNEVPRNGIPTNEAPSIEGFEAIVEIRRIAPSLPILVLGSDARHAKTGLAGYAAKPVSRERLLRAIRQALETGGAQEREPAAAQADRREQEPVKPARILIAEDSADNRLLVRLYLRSRPYHLTFEADGQAAVDRFTGSNFDLILMDVQMPGMDGLTATRAIREMEQERRLPRTPILAMTANGSLEEVQSSLNAGCDEHLSKPTSKLELLRAIERYRQAAQPFDTTRAFEPIPIEAPPGLEHIVPGYLARRRKEFPEMLELLAASDFSRLASLSHNLKGTGEGYGFVELARLGATLEQFAEQEDTIALRSQMIELGDYLDKVQLVAKISG
jgi:two-component system sensor histidine kinase/response regulator